MKCFYNGMSWTSSVGCKLWSNSIYDLIPNLLRLEGRTHREYIYRTWPNSTLILLRASYDKYQFRVERRDITLLWRIGYPGGVQWALSPTYYFREALWSSPSLESGPRTKWLLTVLDFLRNIYEPWERPREFLLTKGYMSLMALIGGTLFLSMVLGLGGNLSGMRNSIWRVWARRFKMF